jgi:hypothetical protein
MNFKLGRRRPSAASYAKALRFGDFRNHNIAIALPPRTVHWSEELKQDRSFSAFTNVMHNDQLGDCTAAGAAHILVLARGVANNGDPMPTPEDTVSFYSKSTGYDPNDPSTDQGGDENTVLGVWQKQGFFPDGSGKIAAWVTVDPGNVQEIKEAIWLSGGGLYFGEELAGAWTSNEPNANGFTWDVAGDPNPQSGHCFIGADYDDPGVIINTWGLIGWQTWAAVAKYASPANGGQLTVVFTQDMIIRGQNKAPNGFAWDYLLEAAKSL